MERYSDSPFLTGENCSYGNSSPFGVITGLIVDDGVPSRGHRDNIFLERWRMGALSYQEGHPTYNGCCVLDYSSFTQPKGQRDIKNEVQQAMDAKVQARIDECVEKYEGGKWNKNYSFGSPAIIKVTFEGKGGKKEQFEDQLDMVEFLYPNVQLFEKQY